ncbi:MAG: site-2 protease family protein [Calditrichaeota bacterium]|nr:MAG: site-2 protease family protein [Calditrichota bacterium]MBL1204961.1 site-2 protease family protein [Calditrichota bacterium]NOG44791.1 site-2 protease family protein [Calditrichota bacterium]
MRNNFQFQLSPIFLILVGTCLFSATQLSDNSENIGIWTFIFVISGWIISLSLHEFGHAYTAFRFGDKSVEEKGYLTLNPLKYTNLLMSIIMPVVFLMMGGIGFPGGAVYINMAAIKTNKEKSLVSAAGPIATLLFAIILIFPFFFGMADASYNRPFWAALSLLALLQISALFLNLLPIPGLDGFGIFEHFLNKNLRLKLHKLSGLFFLAIFFLLFNDTPVSEIFWVSIAQTAKFLGIDFSLVREGYQIFTFWN